LTMRFISLLSCLSILVCVLCACSKGSNPTTPGNESSQWNITTVPVAESNPGLDENPYRGVFGAWKVLIDRENLTAEIIPARNAAKIGDIFDADLSQFLTVSPCSNCMNISGVRIARDGNLHLDLQIRHPFSNLASRPDLHGFDVRAIFIGEAVATAYDPILVTLPDGTQEPAEYALWYFLNPDGLTSHYDGLVNDERYFPEAINCPGNLNPYLRFFDDPGTATFDPHAPSGHNVMPVGSDVDERTLVLSSGWGYNGEALYVVADVAYGQSAVFANRQNPQYYLPSFNRTEPWRMEYWIENNTLSSSDPLSSADVFVQIFDWQHNATVDPNYPDPANLSGIKKASRVTQVELYMPTLSDNPVISTTADSGDGSPGNPLQTKLTIVNEKLGYTFTHTGLIAIRDELNGQAAPVGRSPIPEQPSGFPYETLDILDYSYYGVIRINMPYAGNNNKYLNELTVQSSSQYGQSGSYPKVSFFMDPSGQQFLYEWDFYYDGTTFDVDATGMPCPWIDFTDPPLPGKRIVGLRITTNSVPPRQYLYEIPMWGKGQEFFNEITTYGPPDDSVSPTSTHSVAATDDKFYVAYVSKGYGNHRNIYVAMYDRDSGGDVTSFPVTHSTTGDSFDPAIAVVTEGGSHDGVYIVYVMDVGTKIRPVIEMGDLECNGFDTSPNYQITNHTSENTHPCLVYTTNGRFVCYWQRYTPSTFTSRIFRSVSFDYGATWSAEVEIDDSSTLQYNPSAGFIPWTGYSYCVWQDGRDVFTYGYDLYMEAFKDTYHYIQIISDSREFVHETNPSVAAYDETLAVAYLEYDSSYSRVMLKTFRGGGGSTNIIQSMNTPLVLKSPSVAMCANSQFTVAYSMYDTGSTALTSVVRQCYESETFGYIQYQPIENEPVGNVPSTSSNCFPAVACRRVADGYAIEHFVARNNYSEGYEYQTTPSNMTFGKIEDYCYVTHGDENDPW
jgi:hypothetical protein